VEIDLGFFQLRAWRKGDEESLVRHANNPNVARNLRDRFPHPYTLTDARSWVRHARSQDPITDFAIVVNGEAAGGIGFELQRDVARRSAELGYWLGEAHWGRGIVTEGVRALTRLMFSNFDLNRIYSTVFDGNPASVRVLEKAGFTFEGRMRKAAVKGGRTLDVLLYALLKEP